MCKIKDFFFYVLPRPRLIITVSVDCWLVLPGIQSTLNVLDKLLVPRLKGEKKIDKKFIIATYSMSKKKSSSLPATPWTT